MILLPILAIVRPKKFGDTKAGLLIALAAGTCDVLGTLFYINASQAGRLDVAVILSSLYPGVTVLLAWMFLKERFTARRGMAMAAALLAVPLIAAG